MKLVDGIIISEIDGQYLVVDAGEGRTRFNGIVKLNKSGAYVAELLKNNTTMERIVADMMEHYEISKEVATDNAQRIIDGFQSAGLLE